MTTSQQRYEQTEKGKKARLKATQNYQTKKERWTGYLDPEVSEALEALYPEMSRNAILNKLAQELAQEYLKKD